MWVIPRLGVTNDTPKVSRGLHFLYHLGPRIALAPVTQYKNRAAIGPLAEVQGITGYPGIECLQPLAGFEGRSACGRCRPRVLHEAGD